MSRIAPPRGGATFFNVSPADKSRVVLHCRHFIIDASIALVEGARLTDYLHASDCFIAVVDAEVRDRSGVRIFSAEFLNVHRDTIELAVPAESVLEGSA